jgi:hypothetical protein
MITQATAGRPYPNSAAVETTLGGGGGGGGPLTAIGGGGQGHAAYYDKSSQQYYHQQQQQPGPPKVALNFADSTSSSLGRRQGSFGASDSSDAEDAHSDRALGQDSSPAAGSPEEDEKLKAKLAQKLTSLRYVLCVHPSILSVYIQI